MNHFKVAVLVPFAAAVAIISSVYAATAPGRERLYDVVLSMPVLAGLAYAHPLFWFCVLFILRYLRLLVHTIAVWCYRPSQVPRNRSYLPSDCTVIIPVVDPDNHKLRECLSSCLYNCPQAIIIVTVGEAVALQCRQIIAPCRISWPNTRIVVLVSNTASRRLQIAQAVPQVRTKITVILDEHSTLASTVFLSAAITPFENPAIGGVGTNKKILRTKQGFGMESFWNMMSVLGQERLDFESRAANAIDGGMSVISGGACLHRSKILQDPDFLQAFTNEYLFFGKFGPLHDDSENAIMQYEISRDWRFKFQACDDALVRTAFSMYPTFNTRCLSLARGAWRSNLATIFTDRTVFRAQPWTVYAVYLSSLFNFALFIDPLLIWLLIRTPFATTQSLCLLTAWILSSKTIKLVPYFLRHPTDLVMLPGYFIFAYYHSLLKLYALLTFYKISGPGQGRDTITPVPQVPSSSEDDDNNDDEDDGSDDDENDDDNGNDSNRRYFRASSTRSTRDHTSPIRSQFTASQRRQSNVSHSYSITTPLTTTAPTQIGRFPGYSFRIAGPTVVRQAQVLTVTTPASVFKSPISTPWGPVKPTSKMHTIPANVLEDQYTPTKTIPQFQTSVFDNPSFNAPISPISHFSLHSPSINSQSSGIQSAYASGTSTPSYYGPPQSSRPLTPIFFPDENHTFDHLSLPAGASPLQTPRDAIAPQSFYPSPPASPPPAAHTSSSSSSPAPDNNTSSTSIGSTSTTTSTSIITLQTESLSSPPPPQQRPLTSEAPQLEIREILPGPRTRSRSRTRKQYVRTWERVPACERMHRVQCERLGCGGCAVPDVWGR